MITLTNEPVNRQAKQALSRGVKGRLDTVEQGMDAVLEFLKGPVTHAHIRRHIARGAARLEWRIVLQKLRLPEIGWKIEAKFHEGMPEIQVIYVTELQ